jgi:hypothetical protein
MTDIVPINEIWIFVGCIALAHAAAWATVAGAAPESPVWPVRVYIYLFRTSNVPWFRRYAGSRTSFPRREQFLTSFFIWFFIFFVIAIFAFECNRRGTCY